MSSGARTARVRPWRIAAPWVIAGLLLASSALASAAFAPDLVRVGPSVGVAHVTASPGEDPTISVNMTDAPAFVPKTIGVSAGATVTFALSNQGNLSHSFTLARQPNVTLDPSWSPQQLDHYFATNGSLANTTLAGGQSASVSVNFTGDDSAGTFEFVSVVPYQFQAGMYGFVTVSPSPGGNATTSDNTTDSLTFVPQSIYVGTTSGMHFPIFVHVQVFNLGSLLHTFTLAPQSNVTITIANYTSYFAAHAPLANVTVPSGSGNFVWANFTMKGPGVYMYICEQPGHFANGMEGFLYVDVPLPAVVTPVTGILYIWVLGVAAAIVAIGLTLAVIASYSGRFPPKPGEPGGHH